jgi:hypothetical protein
VFDHFPELQLIIGHWGEMILFYLDRIDDLRGPAKLARRPSEYFRTNIMITPSGVLSDRYTTTDRGQMRGRPRGAHRRTQVSARPDRLVGMGVQTHAMIYTGGMAATMGAGAGPLQFLGPLGAFGKDGNWYLIFYRLPDGKSFEEVRNQATTEYIQAAGNADAMVVEIRKPGGEQWGADWVRYVVGHEHEGKPPLDVAIPLPKGDQMISHHEVFDADEAGKLFMSYHKTGDIPSGYVLRAVEGYTASGDLIDLRDTAS